MCGLTAIPSSSFEASAYSLSSEREECARKRHATIPRDVGKDSINTGAAVSGSQCLCFIHHTSF